MRNLFSLLFMLCLFVPLTACPQDDDDDATTDDDDITSDDDDDTTGDDDDTTGDDDDSTGDDDDSTGDDDDSTGDDDDSTPPPVDADGDGSPEGVDCDDGDAANFPGNTEICDEQDNDCDATTVFAGEDTDVDLDGSVTCLDCDDSDAANVPGGTEVCDAQDNDCDATTVFAGEDTDVDTDGSVTCLDCDDSDANNLPGGTEVCDGVDNDCDATTVFAGEDTDVDADGAVTCLDCDDGDAANFPGNPEICDEQDNDCIVSTVFTGEDTDVDLDGSVTCLDCDDGDANNFPGNTEVCDGAENDCNTVTYAIGEYDDVDLDLSIACLDCDDNDAANTPGGTEICDEQDNDCDATTVFLGEDTDVDTDGSVACLDCDDNDGANTPGGTEICDAQDNDCDGTTWATGEDTDVDNDGSVTCLDCDDNDNANFPGNTEICDEQDNDCDGTTWATGEDTDVDTDGWLTCLDCDDADSANSPGGTEVCDGGDNDCDAATSYGSVEWVPAVGPNSNSFSNRFRANRYLAQENTLLTEVTSWLDGTTGDTISWLVFESDTATTLTDYSLVSTTTSTLTSDDAGWAASDPLSVPITAGKYYMLGFHFTAATGYEWEPGASLPIDAGPLELESGVMYGGSSLPSAADLSFIDTRYRLGFTTAGELDSDNDGSIACLDCDDGDAANTPGGTEVCDGADNDCDGTTWATDEDTDVDNDGSVTCLDCDDNDGANFPGNTEICDEQVNDCDWTTWATGEVTDMDSDGVITCLDCDDNDINNFPGNTEICDGGDNDCANGADFVVTDDDGGGEVNTDTDGYLDCADCDDADSAVNPGATEVCDGVDNDCDTSADAGVLGEDAICAAIDCDDIYTSIGGADDFYWIDPAASGTPFEIFCDMTNDGGGWTLVANVDDVSDPFFGGHTSSFYSQDWIDAWESNSTRNESLIPTFNSDVAVSTKYRSWSELPVTDIRIAYKNDGAYMLMEGLDVYDSLDVLFAMVPSARATCAVNATTLSYDIFSGATGPRIGLNCSDSNENWYTSSQTAENARIGGQDSDFSLSENAFLGAMGDRSFSTSLYEKTWGEFTTGQATDNNIMLFVR